MKTSIGIVGVTGYTGQELLRILLRHPLVEVRYLASRRLKSPAAIGELLPAFLGATPLKVRPFRLQEAVQQCNLLFLALPNGVAMEMAAALLRRRDFRVVDLSGDFRLSSAALFRKAYGLKHASAALLRQAVYGLTEWNRQRIRQARLIANPGCYPTATLLAIGPLAEEGLLEHGGIIVDAKSGVSGAGRSAKEDLLFSEMNEDLRAYKVDAHQHVPEMEQALRQRTKGPVRVTFVPHLVPMHRGIYVTIYAPLKRRMSEGALRAIYRRAYAGEPFIRLLPQKGWPRVKSVAGTNLCDIGLHVVPPGKRAVILAAIDNLGKGAAGQAVQNMNLMCGFPETAGLAPAAVVEP